MENRVKINRTKKKTRRSTDDSRTTKYGSNREHIDQVVKYYEL